MIQSLDQFQRQKFFFYVLKQPSLTSDKKEIQIFWYKISRCFTHTSVNALEAHTTQAFDQEGHIQ